MNHILAVLVAVMLVVSGVLGVASWFLWNNNNVMAAELAKSYELIREKDQKILSLKSIMEMADNLYQANSAIRDLDQDIRKDLKDAEGYDTPIPDDLRNLVERVR